MLDVSKLKSLENGKSSAGVLMKWYDPVNHLYIKSSGYDKKRKRFHLESIAECIASDLAAMLGVFHVPYRLDTMMWRGKEITVCVSPDYTYSTHIDSRISLASYLAKSGNIITRRQDKYAFLVAHLPHIRPSLDSMIVFDYLISNYDRHMRNAELVSRQNCIELAPIYDNGSSLLCDWVTESDLEDLKDTEELYDEVFVTAETPSKGFGHEHAGELRLIDKSVYNDLNLDITNTDISQIVHKYKDYLSPLRFYMITILLSTRLEKLKAHKERHTM
jgi:hypothetical protein